MRKATMLVIKHIYRDEDAIHTVLRYALDSRFAIFNKILASGVRTDYFENIVEDFKLVQEPYSYLKHHKTRSVFIVRELQKKLLRYAASKRLLRVRSS